MILAAVQRTLLANKISKTSEVAERFVERISLIAKTSALVCDHQVTPFNILP